jgi:hypothetical protein
MVLSALTLTAVVDRSATASSPPPGFGALSSHHGEPRTDRWRDIAGLHAGVDASSDNECERGDGSCLDAVVDEMAARLAAIGCAHAGPFALTYLEMTRGVQRRVQEPDFFRSPAGTANFDALFAQAYFDAFDNWTSGSRDHVPGAWLMAFEAADGGATSAAADLLLGMNAHIARDLPYVVAAAIEANPALADAPEDFTKVNDVIAEVKTPMLLAVASRFDPMIESLDQPVPALARSAPVDLIATWRNHAFELGRQLALASAADRPGIAATIEREAVATAAVILNADATSTLERTADRDAYCAAHAPEG